MTPQFGAKQKCCPKALQKGKSPPRKAFQKYVGKSQPPYTLRKSLGASQHQKDNTVSYTTHHHQPRSDTKPTVRATALCTHRHRLQSPPPLPYTPKQESLLSRGNTRAFARPGCLVKTRPAAQSGERRPELPSGGRWAAVAVTRPTTPPPPPPQLRLGPSLQAASDPEVPRVPDLPRKAIALRES